MTTLLPPPHRATARLRIRKGAPSTASPRVGYLEAGALFAPLAEIVGEAVAGNAIWFELADERFVWSGASVEAVGQHKPPQTSSMDVPRRSDNGAIGVLSDAQREAVFGRFPYQEGAGGRIRIDPAWTKANLTTIETPLLADNGFAKITVHVKAAQPFLNVFAKIAAAGLGDRILTCAGTWVARHKSWNPKRGLSSHSWGAAIDLNAAWNAYGMKPAALGATGSVRELVPIFESEGFAWGGYFQPAKDADGMHFELSRRDI